MRTPIRWIALAAALATACSACMTVPRKGRAAARKADYFATPHELSAAVRDAIQRGHVIAGMDTQQVWVVLGDPAQKRHFVSAAAIVEVWLYPAHKLHQEQLRGDRAGLFRLVFRDGVLVLVEPLI